MCCKHTVTFQRPPSESWEQRDGLVGEHFLFATQGTDAIYNDSCCPQLGMKTISICPDPQGDCRTRDVLYVSAQCPLLKHESGRMGTWHRGAMKGWGDEGWGKGMVPKETGFACYLRSYRWFLFSCGFEKPPACSAGGPFLPEPNLELPNREGKLKGL